MVDTGASVSLVKNSYVNGYERQPSEVRLETLSGELVHVTGCVCLESVVVDCKQLGPVQPYVVSRLPLNVDLVIGLDVVLRCGMTVDSAGVSFGNGVALGAVQDESGSCRIDDKDFSAWFNGDIWTVRWNWKEGASGAIGSSRSYVADTDEAEVDTEIKEWLDSGILVRYDASRHGKVQRYLPLLAVRQEKRGTTKVRPVFDYRETNKMVESHPGGATPICAERLRTWRQVGEAGGVLDLKKAYLQIRIVPELWVHQAIRWKDEVFLLTRLGFGLSSAPKIMTAIVERVLSQSASISGAVTSYIDDLFVATEAISCEDVRAHLRKWGLEAKEPQLLGRSEGVRVLGLHIDKELKWSRDLECPRVPEWVMTKRQVHGILGRWLGHYPVGGWLRVASGFIQREIAALKIGWDDEVDQRIMDLLISIEMRMQDEGDPVGGRWVVSPDEPLVIWADASKIAIGVKLEVNGDIIEDAAWLRPADDTGHINRSELDAIIKGINMALKWGHRSLTVKTDSSTAYGWLRGIIERTHSPKVKGLDETLVRRRLQILGEVIDSEKLSISVDLVRSRANLADSMTRVPSAWTAKVRQLKPGKASDEDIRAVHECGHFGVDRTLELAKEKFGEAVAKQDVKQVVSSCEMCSRFDPAATFKWHRGSIKSDNIWGKWAVDVTHVGGTPFLSLIDIASKFTIWKKLREESSREIAVQIKCVFCEFGSPGSIMTDNGTAFRGREVRDLLLKWDVRHLFSCAYRAQGNSVVERIHRTIKRTAKRSGMTVEEAVFWWNVTKDSEHSPYELVFSSSARKPGISVERVDIQRPTCLRQECQEDDRSYHDVERNPFVVGDKVYLRPPSGRCDDEWSGPHIVTSVRSSVSLVIDDDGVSRHVSHVRLVPGSRLNGGESDVGDVDDGDVESESCSESSNGIDLPRRSTRERRPPDRYGDWVLG